VCLTDTSFTDIREGSRRIGHQAADRDTAMGKDLVEPKSPHWRSCRSRQPWPEHPCAEIERRLCKRDQRSRALAHEGEHRLLRIEPLHDPAAARYLHRDELPFEPFKLQLRQPDEEMPAYSAAVISDEQIADIYAFVRSLQGRRDPKSIAILND
jgi:hypothetical protein